MKSKRKVVLSNRCNVPLNISDSNDEEGDYSNTETEYGISRLKKVDVTRCKFSKKSLIGKLHARREYSNEQERVRRQKLRLCRENFRQLCPSAYLSHVREGGNGSSKRQPTRIEVLKGVLNYLEDTDKIEQYTFSLINELKTLDKTMSEFLDHYEMMGIDFPSNFKQDLLNSTSFSVRSF